MPEPRPIATAWRRSLEQPDPSPAKASRYAFLPVPFSPGHALPPSPPSAPARSLPCRFPPSIPRFKPSGQGAGPVKAARITDADLKAMAQKLRRAPGPGALRKAGPGSPIGAHRRRPEPRPDRPQRAALPAQRGPAARPPDQLEQPERHARIPRRPRAPRARPSRAFPAGAECPSFPGPAHKRISRPTNPCSGCAILPRNCASWTKASIAWAAGMRCSSRFTRACRYGAPASTRISIVRGRCMP